MADELEPDGHAFGRQDRQRERGQTEEGGEELMGAAAGVVVLALLNFRGVTKIAPYVLAGIFIWVCVLKSGVHATLAGVVTALAVPLSSPSLEEPSPLEHLEKELHPWVAFGVLPLFAFANAGVSLAGLTVDKLLGTITLGVALGLFIGKPVGIFTATWLAVRTGLGAPPEDASWRQILGVAMLGGIGFTMSLFIGMLAFPGAAHAAEVRLGVLVGSVLSALAGYYVLNSAAIGQAAAAAGNTRPSRGSP